ncbi:histidine phosphatase family protein [uncultured Algimonas sp.]|uniref:histidine phosphatase family protein n=1 Tax=uncultured Algimonas sp. TaxID=1547920 RepID=UPI0026096AAE|nr:histidine phosphatase family protein [uncultured Algimonas sp.]
MDTIILVRHGKPALSRKVRLTWTGFRDWWHRYDEGGIAPGQTPPDKVAHWAHRADLVLSSPLPRAVQSAELAAGRMPDDTLPGLVEAALPSPPLGPWKMRPKSWGTVARILWCAGYSDGMETLAEARARAEIVSETLGRRAAGGKIVYVSGHGWFNRMLKGSLIRRGWRCVSQNGDLHWSRRRLVRPTTGPAKEPSREKDAA